MLKNYFKNKFNQFNKDELLHCVKLFITFFILYSFILSLTMVVMGALYNEVFFSSDTFRVYGDMALRSANHYRTLVHPLFVIFIQPFVVILSKFTGERLVAAVLVYALIAAINIVIFYLFVKKLGVSRFKSTLLASVFSLIFSQLIFSMTFETYIFAQLFLMSMWLYASFRAKSRLTSWDYILIVLFGVGSIGITITNVFQYFIFLLVMFLFNKKKDWLIKIISLSFVALSVSVLLSQIQNFIWPSAPEFLRGNIEKIKHGTLEERDYIDSKLTASSLIRQINASTVYNIGINKFRMASKTNINTFNDDGLTNLIGLLTFAAFVFLNVAFIIRHRRHLFSKHSLYAGLVLAYLFNFILHLFYGNTVSFLYTLHYNFIILWLLVYVVKNQSRYHKLVCHKRFTYLTFAYLSMQVLVLVNFVIYLISIFGLNRSLPKLMILLWLLLAFCFLVIHFRKKNLADKAVIVSVCLISIFALSLEFNSRYRTYSTCFKELFTNYPAAKIFFARADTKKYVVSLREYLHELDIKMLNENFTVEHLEATNKLKANFMFFGMADRPKMLYRDAKLYDLQSGQVIRQWSLQQALIIPNEYTVIMLDNRGEIEMLFENENGVFLKHDNKVELLAKGEAEIKLPEFYDKKYRNTLKVLHQEMLFSIDKTHVRRNYFAQQSSDLCKTIMMMAMALKVTENDHLLDKWVSQTLLSVNLDDLKVDDLGRLLYIIGLLDIKDHEAVNRIVNHLSLRYYNEGRTSWQLNALLLDAQAKFGLKLPFEPLLPDHNDGFAKTTWWHGDRKFHDWNDMIADRAVPELEWAHVHYFSYGTVHFLNELYPLTYSLLRDYNDGQLIANDHYTNSRVLLSDGLHAAEMFLCLSESSYIR